MDVSSLLGGNWLSHPDLPAPWQTWTISQGQMQLVGGDQKFCVTFVEFPSKPLVLNKTNLRRTAELYSTNAKTWIGRQLLVYRSLTTFGSENRLCVRVCGPQQMPPDPIHDQHGNVVPYQPQPPQPVAQQPAAVQAPATPPLAQVPPWDTDAATENSPGA